MSTPDARTRAVIEGGTVRALRVDVSSIAAEAVARHGLEGTSALVCTEAITCATLLSAYLDDEERLTLQIQASDPRFAVTVDVGSDGSVRARLTPSRLPQTERIRGVMLVLKSVVGREVYRGASEVDHATLEEMLRNHLDRSTQAPAAIAIHGAVGAFVERLPASPTAPEDLQALAGLVLAAGIDGEVQPLRWACTCSEERVLDMIAGLGASEIRAMIDEDGGAVVQCHFCMREVAIGADRLRQLL